MRVLKLSAILAGAGAILAGCVESRPQLTSDFGAAFRENVVSQIADPDAAYKDRAPPADGARAALAMERYRTGKVKEPVGTTASTIGVAMSADAGK